MNIFTNVSTIAPAVRAGRNVLGWTQKDLGEKAGISIPTIARLETEGNPVASTVLRVLTTLKIAGVTFDWRDDGFEMIYKMATLPDA